MTQDDDAVTSPTVLLGLAEAASRLGLSQPALRSRIRRGLVTARRGNSGRLSVEVPVNLPVRHDEQTPSPDDDLAAEVDELRRELGEARITAARAIAERDAAIATAQAKVDAAERIITELRGMLKDVRRPWWHRLIKRESL